MNSMSQKHAKNKHKDYWKAYHIALGRYIWHISYWNLDFQDPNIFASIFCIQVMVEHPKLHSPATWLPEKQNNLSTGNKSSKSYYTEGQIYKKIYQTSIYKWKIITRFCKFRGGKQGSHYNKTVTFQGFYFKNLRSILKAI